MTASVRRAALTAVKVTAGVIDAVHRPPPGVTVLIYHRVGGGSGLEVDLPTELFEAQCAHLAAHAAVMRLGDALEALATDVLLPPRAVVITFDDGTRDFTDHAVPILAQFGLPATMYVATDFVERQREFPDGGMPMTWTAAADAMSTGLIEFGSHTHTHRVLAKVDAMEAADELDRSMGLLEERLGRRARDFAYPKAVAGSPAADAAVRARFRSGVLAGGRPNGRGADPYTLQRIPIQVTDGIRWFRRKAAGGMLVESTLRSHLDRRRYEDSAT